MRVGSALKSVVLVLPLMLALPTSEASAATSPAAASAASGCQLPSKTGARHVVFVQFDNVHLRRDNPNVPSDLEQMPNLLNFLQGQGVLLDNHHTPLVSHTADDILTATTGLYGDRQGNPIANSYREYVKPDGSSTSMSSFQYWTNKTLDGSYNVLDQSGQNTPAPWVPYTRAGCNVGSVGMANTAIESPAEVAQIYGPNSPEALEVASHSPNAYPDFVGVGIHCAKGAAACAAGNHGIADRLPNEPGGYAGYNTVLGHKYVAPLISSGPLKDLDGNVIADRFGGRTIPGFPGFDGLTASASLGYTAAMLEHGVPVTYSYVALAHADASGNHAGPGQADYVARLKAYDGAWGKFFARLKGDGITRDNTLFVIGADENDHFAGGPPTPANCDGVHTPCNYAAIGEVHVNLAQLMQQAGNNTPFEVNPDSAPAIYLKGQPARDAAVSRQFEQTLARLTVTNPLKGRDERLFDAMADPVGLRFLHMVTADPRRTPTLVAFAKPDYWVTTAAAVCPGGPVVECPPSFGTDAWIHGDYQEQITRTWFGLVGPGVQRLGRNGSIWSDHTDLRPTMMLLTGLKDDYAHQGRALFEIMTEQALPTAARDHLQELVALGRLYKAIEAPVGPLGLAVLRISTLALVGDDGRYARLEQAIAGLTSERNTLGSAIITLLESASFGGGHGWAEANTNSLKRQSSELLGSGRRTADQIGN